jgi:cytochrome b
VNLRRLAVWDLPTRLFHWTLAVAVLLSWVSQQEDYLVVHQWSGYYILVLVAFRLCWGFLGSHNSRFGNFLVGPRALMDYLKGGRAPGAGHNPVGGWAILLMLVLLLAQGFTGLFNSDGLMYDGPFYHALEAALADELGAWHGRIFWLLLGVIALHIGAVLVYQIIKGRDLLGPMIHGGTRTDTAEPNVTLWRALGLLVLCACLLASALYFAPAPLLPW